MRLSAPEYPTLGVSEVFDSPPTPEKRPRSRKKKMKKKKHGANQPQFLGEDPEERRKAAERIQAIQRGKWGRREAEKAKQARRKVAKKTGRREFSTYRGMAPTEEDVRPPGQLRY